ncbi:MAG: GPP34 family phosphoprotein [Bacteroidetes bacterium]|nr:GPP34 family phosphoprotein [Bacteroidota bacterium]
MELNLIEDFLLISLDDEKGRFILDTTYVDNGLAGAVMLELALNGKIELRDNRIHLINSDPLGNLILDQAMQAINNEKKDRKVSFWIGALNANASDIKHVTLKNLTEKGIISKQEGKTLWVFSYNKYPTKDALPENEVRSRLNNIVLDKMEPTPKCLMLLNLIDVCELSDEVFRTKEVRKAAKNKIRELTKSRSDITDQTTLVVQTAIIAATMSAVIASTTAST